jgi:hypothetical protein
VKEVLMENICSTLFLISQKVVFVFNFHCLTVIDAQLPFILNNY